jgi:hypothetical protein
MMGMLGRGAGGYGPIERQCTHTLPWEPSRRSVQGIGSLRLLISSTKNASCFAPAPMASLPDVVRPRMCMMHLISYL